MRHLRESKFLLLMSLLKLMDIIVELMFFFLFLSSFTVNSKKYQTRRWFCWEWWKKIVSTCWRLVLPLSKITLMKKMLTLLLSRRGWLIMCSKISEDKWKFFGAASLLWKKENQTTLSLLLQQECPNMSRPISWHAVWELRGNWPRHN